MNFPLWQQARIGKPPDVASGRCVQLHLCPTRLSRGHRKTMRSNAKATSNLHSKTDRQIKSRDNTIDVRGLWASAASVIRGEGDHECALSHAQARACTPMPA